MDEVKKIRIPKKIATQLDECQPMFRFNSQLLWMGASCDSSLEYVDYKDFLIHKRIVLDAIHEWTIASDENKAVVLAYINPVTSPLNMPQLWQIEEES